jgi:hypothetical protein
MNDSSLKSCQNTIPVYLSAMKIAMDTFDDQMAIAITSNEKLAAIAALRQNIAFYLDTIEQSVKDDRKNDQVVYFRKN